MNFKTNHPIDSIVEMVFVITLEIAYASFLNHNDFNISLHVVVHHLSPPTGIVKS